MGILATKRYHQDISKSIIEEKHYYQETLTKSEVMSERKRFCKLGNLFCKQAYNISGKPYCRLLGGALDERVECVKTTRQHKQQRVDLWFEANGWQKRILFMRGVSYQKANNIIIRDAKGVIFNGMRLETRDELTDSLATILPNWIIEQLSILRK